MIAENEEKLAPGRICDGSGEHLRTFVCTYVCTCYLCALGKKKQEAFRQQQHSTPKAVNITTKPSAKMHSKSPSKHTTPSTVHHRHQRSSANQVVHSPRSTPTANHMTPHSVTRRVGGDTLPSAVTISDQIQLRELFNILKGYE